MLMSVSTMEIIFFLFSFGILAYIIFDSFLKKFFQTKYKKIHTRDIRTRSFNLANGIMYFMKKINSSEIDKTEKILGKKLPSSFKEWLIKFGDQVNLEKGGLIVDKLLPTPFEKRMSSIAYNSRELIDAEWPINKDFLPFASDGSEGIIAFYTKYHVNDEYPIVSVEFMAEDKNYYLLGMNFKEFIENYVNPEITKKNRLKRYPTISLKELNKQIENRLE